MRTPLPALAAAVLLLPLGACDAPAVATGPPSPTVEVPRLPVSVAGGACELLGYPTIEEHLGVRFDVAVAGRVADAATCVVQARRASRPDVVLSMSGVTSADAALFAAELTPAGGRPVRGLGRAAYQLPVAPGPGRGAGAEIGWLSQDTRIITLRYTTAPDAAGEPAGRLAARLLGLAKAVDRSHG